MSTVDFLHCQDGDVGVAHSKGLVGFLIRLVTRSDVNHAFVVEHHGPTPGTTWIIQAELHGVERTTLDKVAPGGWYKLLTTPDGVDRGDVVAFAQYHLGTHYAILSIVSTLITLATPRAFRVDFRRDGTLFCSALVALALLSGGWQRTVPDYYQVTPADIDRALA